MTRTLEEKKVFLFTVYVGHIDDSKQAAYMEDFKNNMQYFSNYQDVETIFVTSQVTVGSNIVQQIY